MLPSTVELLRDILREAEFLEIQVRNPRRNLILWEVATSKAAALVALLRPIVEAATKGQG